MDLFGKSRGRSAVLIDVTADSVGGAYFLMEKGKTPALVYTNRVSFVPRVGEDKMAMFARTLGELGDALIREGAPALARAAGSGKIDHILSVIGAPWTEASVRVERLEGEKGGSFVFNKAAIDASLKPPKDLPADKLFLDETVLATFLDGYESKKPVGERAHRASIILLSATVDKTIAEPLAAALRALYHTHDMSLAAGVLALHRGLAALFPHEDDYLALRAEGGVGTLLLIRRGVLLATTSVSLEPDPAGSLEKAFGELARTQPLPHSVFLIASDAQQEGLKTTLADPRFASLWLSDDPPRILPVRSEHLQLGGKITIVGNAQADLSLGLVALFCAQQEA